MSIPEREVGHRVCHRVGPRRGDCIESRRTTIRWSDFLFSKARRNRMPYAKGDGASLYWEERGSGEPVLRVRGLGATLDLWSRLVPELSARYRAILFDNRG